MQSKAVVLDCFITYETSTLLEMLRAHMFMHMFTNADFTPASLGPVWLCIW